MKMTTNQLFHHQYFSVINGLINQKSNYSDVILQQLDSLVGWILVRYVAVTNCLLRLILVFVRPKLSFAVSLKNTQNLPTVIERLCKTLLLFLMRHSFLMIASSFTGVGGPWRFTATAVHLKDC